ncbi:MAG: hypothetical protein IJT01_11060 [Selenomonadaceae bacterium]|nr:hypothetical protein [Selenomonadaceae bacterium]
MKEENRDLMRYGHLNVLLQMLVKKKKVTLEEARGIKKIIMKKYRVLSDYSA